MLTKPAKEPDDDEALARRAAGGCAASFAALIETHYDRIHAFAWRWCGNARDAEDVAQDVCVKLAGAIRGFRFDAAFTTWVYRITYTTAIDHLRAAQRMQPAAPSQIMSLVDGPMAATPESEAIDAELWDHVRALPPQQRDAVLLVYAQDMSHAEAASVMGCAEKTVSWHLHEARKCLKARLADNAQEAVENT